MIPSRKLPRPSSRGEEAAAAGEPETSPLLGKQQQQQQQGGYPHQAAAPSGRFFAAPTAPAPSSKMPSRDSDVFTLRGSYATLGGLAEELEGFERNSAGWFEVPVGQKTGSSGRGRTNQGKTEGPSSRSHYRSETELTWGSNFPGSFADRVKRIAGSKRRRRRSRRGGVGNLSFLLLVAVAVYAVVVFAVPLALHLRRDRASWCPYADDGEKDDKYTKQLFLPDVAEDESPYENPDYSLDPCRYVRLPCLLGLTLEDCDMSRRMVVSVLLGGVIGFERRSADRPAGKRIRGGRWAFPLPLRPFLPQSETCSHVKFPRSLRACKVSGRWDWCPWVRASSPSAASWLSNRRRWVGMRRE